MLVARKEAPLRQRSPPAHSDKSPATPVKGATFATHEHSLYSVVPGPVPGVRDGERYGAAHVASVAGTDGASSG